MATILFKGKTFEVSQDIIDKVQWFSMLLFNEIYMEISLDQYSHIFCDEEIMERLLGQLEIYAFNSDVAINIVTNIDTEDTKEIISICDHEIYIFAQIYSFICLSAMCDKIKQCVIEYIKIGKDLEGVDYYNYVLNIYKYFCINPDLYMLVEFKRHNDNRLNTVVTELIEGGVYKNHILIDIFFSKMNLHKLSDSYDAITTNMTDLVNDDRYPSIVYRWSGNFPEIVYDYGITNKTLATLSEFQRRFNDISNHMFDGYEWKDDNSGIIIAGGSVFTILTNRKWKKYSDIDIYVYGSTEEDIKRRTNNIINHMTQFFGLDNVIIGINNCVLYIFSKYTTVGFNIIVNNLYKHPTDIINIYDFTHVRMYYDGSDVYIQACAMAGIIYDMTMSSVKKPKLNRVYKIYRNGLYIYSPKDSENHYIDIKTITNKISKRFYTADFVENVLSKYYDKGIIIQKLCKELSLRHVFFPVIYEDILFLHRVTVKYVSEQHSSEIVDREDTETPQKIELFENKEVQPEIESYNEVEGYGDIAGKYVNYHSTFADTAIMGHLDEDNENEDYISNTYETKEYDETVDGPINYNNIPLGCSIFNKICTLKLQHDTKKYIQYPCDSYVVYYSKSIIFPLENITCIIRKDARDIYPLKLFLSQQQYAVMYDYISHAAELIGKYIPVIFPLSFTRIKAVPDGSVKIDFRREEVIGMDTEFEQNIIRMETQDVVYYVISDLKLMLNKIRIYNHTNVLHTIGFTVMCSGTTIPSTQ